MQYPDGSPAANAEVTIIGGGGGKTTVTCDEQGRFELASLPAGEAFVKVKAEGKDFAQVKLPASLFASGDVAIVAPPYIAGTAEFDEIADKFSTSLRQALADIGAA